MFYSPIILILLSSYFKSSNCAATSITTDKVRINVSPQSVYVKLSNGQVLIGNRKLVNYLGTNGNNLAQNVVYEFLGLPFAEPPKNLLRFKFPVKLTQVLPVSPYNATYARPECMQDSSGAKAFVNMDEDCLYMNIWVPVTTQQDLVLNANSTATAQYVLNGFLGTNGETKTTMYWIYGGSFNSGSSSYAYYQGDVMAATENVIVASSNYRVGSFGFLYLNVDQVPGNAGLADQLLAIEWYRDNFAVYFGGSLSSICLWGESAGAMSVHNQLFSYKSNLSYFNRVIMESGAYDDSFRPPNQVLPYSLLFIQKVGCYNSNSNLMVSCLLTTDAKNLTAYQLIVDWRPTLDFNGLISNDFRDYAGSKLNVDVFLGINQNEAAFFASYVYSGTPLLSQEDLDLNNIANDTTRFNNDFVFQRLKESFLESVFNNSNYLQCVSDLYTTTNNFYLNDYYNNTIDYNLNSTANLASNSRYLAWMKLSKIVSDIQFNCPAIKLSTKLTSTDRTFFYKFNKRSPRRFGMIRPNWWGVTHADEIEYVFGRPLCDETVGSFNQEDRQLSIKMMNYWANFAKYGKLFSKYDSKNRTFFIDFTAGSVSNTPSTEANDLIYFRNLTKNCDFFKTVPASSSYATRYQLCMAYTSLSKGPTNSSRRSLAFKSYFLLYFFYPFIMKLNLRF